MNNKLKEPIFIVGMPRSGTTLLKSILNSHPSITIPRETAFFSLIKEYKSKNKINNEKEFGKNFWHWYIEKRRFTYLGLREEEVKKNMLKNDFSLFDIFDSVMRTFMLTQGKNRWGEKSPGHELFIDEILNFYPNAKIIYILRDPRAVYNSLKNTEWNKDQFISVIIKRYNRSIEVIKKFENDKRFKLVKYEDLVNKTDENIKSICNFIDEEYHKDMIYNRKSEFTPTENIDQIFSVSHEKNFSKRNIDNTSLYKWKDTLSQFEISLIETFTNQQIFNDDYKKVGKKLVFVELLKYYYLKTNYYSKSVFKKMLSK